MLVKKIMKRNTVSTAGKLMIGKTLAELLDWKIGDLIAIERPTMNYGGALVLTNTANGEQWLKPKAKLTAPDYAITVLHEFSADYQIGDEVTVTTDGEHLYIKKKKKA